MLDLRSIQINFIHSGFSTPLLPSGGTSISEKRRGEKGEKRKKNRRSSARKIAKRSPPYERKIALPSEENRLERARTRCTIRWWRGGRRGGTHSREVERTKEGRKRQGSRGCVEEGCKAGQRSVRRGSASEHKRNF